MTTTTLFKRKRATRLPKLRYTIDLNMRDYSKDEFFVKKFEKAKAALAKRGNGFEFLFQQ